MSSAPSGSARWEWDISADRLTWSDELYRMYGLEPREFRASYDAYLERVHRDDRKRVDLIVRQALRDGRPFDFDHRLVQPDGTVRLLRCYGEVEKAPDGRVIKISGTSEDVTKPG
jgi:PAS domain-containing protein